MTHKINKINLEKIPLNKVKHIGEKKSEALNTVSVYTVQDLLEYRPRRYLDRSMFTPLNQLKENETATVLCDIYSKQVIFRGKKRLILKLSDGRTRLEAVWFHQVDLFSKIFKERQTVAFSGKVTKYKTWQMVHPDFDIIAENRQMLHTGQIIPLYPGTEILRNAGLNNYSFRRIFNKTLQIFRESISENLPDYILKKYKLLNRSTALQQLHFPESTEHLNEVLRRFKYEELFFLELLMALNKHHNRMLVYGIGLEIENQKTREIVDSLPFKLTEAQRKVLREIYFDLKSNQPMNRLLQGDVGSGKTVVALLSLFMVISGGYQGAIMAPTEILTQQHYFNIKTLLDNDQINITYLIGSLKAKEKKKIHSQIASGEIDLVIGTHALIQENVKFKNLGLVIIDEQHRFGVMQRAELIEKGLNPNVLVMTATPIPRTLALTLYGDLDISIINELPPGRQKIETYWRNEDKTNLIYDFIKQKVNQAQQVFIVYPLIEESEKMDLKAATEAFHYLQKNVFQEFNLSLLHGRIPIEEKEKIMADFKNGKTQILIATTVIEVGVDIPNASIMLIEHAERFGLSQLHQLRGRVGRGAEKSYCVLVTPKDINDIAKKRMQILEQTNDGFIIADEDLRLRGSGDFFGTRQHGLPNLNYSDLIEDKNIVITARKDAFEIVKKDPHLRHKNHNICREYFQQKFAQKFNMANIA